MDMFDGLGPEPPSDPDDKPARAIKAKAKKRTRSRKPTDQEVRLRCLELASSGHYDTPRQTMARARSYLTFVMTGPAPKPQQNRKKSPISKRVRKPLILRRKR